MFIFASKENNFANLLYQKLSHSENESWIWIKTKEELSVSLTEEKKEEIEKVFFFHWSFIVPKSIYQNFECVVIHTANLPNGRGGSPIQNQIVDGITHSHVNALRMIGKLDAGDIYCRRPITFQGNLNDIWYMITISSYQLIREIIENNLQPVPQAEPETETYRRRKDNQVPFDTEDLTKIYDFIRMLDGNGYPRAYLELEQYKLEFSRPSYEYNQQDLLCDVRIIKK